MDLALNNLQWLIYHKTKPKQTKPNQKQFLKDCLLNGMGGYNILGPFFNSTFSIGVQRELLYVIAMFLNLT